MSIRNYSIYIYFLALLAVFPLAATAQKKSKHAVPATTYDVEPDRFVARAIQDKHGRTIEAVGTSRTSTAKVNMKYKEGIDVSRYQGTIDWEQVATEDISYAYMKATEGASLVDVTYKRNIREARKHGISVGSYHFYRPNISIDEQFNNMTSTVLKEEQDLVPLIDIETRGSVSEDQFISDLREFIERVAAHYGKKPLLYTFHNFYNKHLVGQFPDYHWMIARYRSDSPTLNDGKDFIMWQYTASGSVSGIRGNVDRSRIMGNFQLHHVAF